jgi:transglutaminase-like putative cysteine protease
MRRTLLVWPLPAAVIALAWLRLEDPRGAAGRVVAVLALALLPALVSRPVARGVVAGAALLVAAVLALDVSPVALVGSDPFFSALYDRAGAGLRAFYDVALPFDAVARSEMHSLVLLAIFAFALLLALALRAGRPVLACLAIVGGAGWPSVLVVGPGDLTRGAVILAACLFVLAALRPGRRLVRPALVAGTAVLAAAVAASTSSAVARGNVLDWQSWSPYVKGQRVSVDYVWRGQYQGIQFPNHPTTVFEVEAPDAARYWRATTLDGFDNDAWDESLRVTLARPSGGQDLLLNDETLASRARNPRLWLKQRVSIAALGDDHLPAAATPVAWDRGDAGQLYSEGGVAIRPGGLHRGETYTVWSYAARPQPGALARLGADYPPGGFTLRELDVGGGVSVPPFGTPGRDADVRQVLTTDPLFGGASPIADYAPLYRIARRVVGNAPTPYAAAVALEAWFRTGGGFAYDEQPAQAAGVPPLVGFVTETRAGYCQHFAGAMALMLRYLGIPARVAGGFTSGRWNRDRERWIVSDTDAHAWVEVWFPGYGWLPFDPTPSRGSFDAPYSNASVQFNADAAVTALGAGGGLGLEALLKLARARRGRLPDAGGVDRPGASSSGSSSATSGRSALAGVVLLAALLLVVLIAAAKWTRRRVRYIGRDPRGVAAAARREVEELAADQGVRVSPAATPAEVAALLHGELGVDGGPLARAIAAARFAPPADAGSAAVRARREIAELRRSLRQQLSLVARVRGLLSLRSLRA